MRDLLTQPCASDTAGCFDYVVYVLNYVARSRLTLNQESRGCLDRMRKRSYRGQETTFSTRHNRSQPDTANNGHDSDDDICDYWYREMWTLSAEIRQPKNCVWEMTLRCDYNPARGHKRRHTIRKTTLASPGLPSPFPLARSTPHSCSIPDLYTHVCVRAQDSMNVSPVLLWRSIDLWDFTFYHLLQLKNCCIIFGVCEYCRLLPPDH